MGPGLGGIVLPAWGHGGQIEPILIMLNEVEVTRQEDRVVSKLPDVRGNKVRKCNAVSGKTRVISTNDMEGTAAALEVGRGSFGSLWFTWSTRFTEGQSQYFRSQ